MTAALTPDAFGLTFQFDLESHDATRARSLQSDAGTIGVSDLHSCREKVRRTLLGHVHTDTTEKWAALVGTYVDSGVKEARAASGRNLLHDVELKVTLPNGVILPGHADEIDPAEPSVTDYKGLSLDTLLPTPTGWTTMGEVAVGDTLFGSDGTPCRVTHKSAVKYLPTYIVRFADGSQVVCDDEHYWWVLDGYPPVTGEPVVRQVQEIKKRVQQRPAGRFGSVNGFRVPNAAPLDLPHAELPIPPWALGAWLGDGNSYGASVTIGNADHEEMADLWAAADRPLGKLYDGRNDCGTYAVPGIFRELRLLNLFKNKHVPATYLRGSIVQRQALVRGLMDTDGSWNGRRRRAAFTTTSKALAEGMRELLCSLGERPNTDWRTVTGFGVETTRCLIEWTPTLFNPFALGRKAQRVDVSDAQRIKGSTRSIVSVVDGPDVPTACVAVDSPNRTYLCGEAMIPTHNTKDELADIRRLGADEKDRAQRHLYYLGAAQAGIVPAEGIVRNIFLDRSGSDPRPHVEQEPFDMDVVLAAQAWYEDSLYAAEHGEEAQKDWPRSMCERYCQFFTACRGSEKVEEEYLTGHRAKQLAEFDTARNQRKEAEAVEKALRRELLGTTGRSDTHWVRSTTSNGNKPSVRLDAGRIDAA